MSHESSRSRAAWLPRALDHLKIAALALLATLIAACGGGEEGVSQVVQPSGCGGGGCGKAVITMTDAPGDFLAYTVDVTSLRLRKAGGTEVETLPATSRIDFTTLVDLDEVISAGQVPPGIYVSALLTLDYRTAEILVEDDAGNAVPVAPVDAQGQPLGVVQMAVQLDERNHLRIDAGRIALLAFDLNLEASNTVDRAAGTVAVSPFLVASVVPQPAREMRVRGRLASVDVAGSAYTIDVRPLHARSGAAGQLVVNTTGATAFEVHGEVFTGVAGLNALAALTDNPLVIAFGTWQVADQRFTAQRVLAGSSAEPRHDYLSGNVLARDGNVLAVGGVRLVRQDGRFGFVRGRVALTVGANTRVTRAGQGGGQFDIADLSVGQRIEAFGEASVLPGEAVTMDATAGAVRMDYTHLFGTVGARDAGGLTLALRSIDGRNAEWFDFSGTGIAPQFDADPANYEVRADGLEAAGLAVGAWTRLIGFVTPFGTAPPDFTARSVVDFAGSHAVLGITWGRPGTTTPFNAVTANALVLDLADPALQAGSILIGGRLVHLRTLATGLAVQPATDGALRLAIGYGNPRRIENFSSFADFSARLTMLLDGRVTATKLVADGRYDAPGGRFVAQQLLVVLGD